MVSNLVIGGDWVVLGIKYGGFFLKRNLDIYFGGGGGGVSFCVMKRM